MTVVGAIRPDSVNLPLLLHVLGAMLLVGCLFTVVLLTAFGRRRPEHAPGLSRFALRTLLLGVLPAYVLMRIGAQWTEAEQDYPSGFSATWLDIGYLVADAGALLVAISAVLAGIGLRRGDGVRYARIVGVISLLVLAAALVAVWAMSTKPT